jgi:hypothetical protein
MDRAGMGTREVEVEEVVAAVVEERERRRE